MSNLLDALIKENLITIEQLQDAKDKQIGAKKPIQELLIEMGFIKEEDFMKTASMVLNMPVINPNNENIDSSTVDLISCETAKRYGVFPVRKKGNTLILAMSNPQDIMALDDIKLMTKMEVKLVLSKKSDISDCIKKYYQLDDSLYDLLKNVADDGKIESLKGGESKGEAISAGILEEHSPIIKLVNLILSDAVKVRASDIHIEPQENYVDVRYRIDGYLKDIMRIPNNIHPRLSARIKILSNLDIAETRKSQDGRFTMSANGRKIDLRISIIPTYYGEKIVLRLLDAKEAKIELDKIGFQQKELSIFTETLNRPGGMVLVTGPTGSGKTSTLYAALNYIKSETKNIITIEDPIEYLIDGINQIQINPVKNITFTTGLKSILRQDPNVILVGEIRDKETAEIAFRASLTGHIVFSTLHTNSAVSSITRLLDIGLEPYLIASSIILIAAQRLVRIICPHCKEEYTPNEETIDKFGTYIEKFNIRKFYKGKGCEQCIFTGFLGRTAIFEILKIDEKIKDLISEKSTEDIILREARKRGMKQLNESGFEKVAKGITTLEEIGKVVGIVKEDKIYVEQKGLREKPKILIADDEEDILKVVEKRLKIAGYDVVKARDGKEAIEYAVKEKPDLIVTDVTMPRMNGFEATKILRSKLETAVIPIIMLTGRQDEKSELKGLDAGADDYITKPFSSEKLLARIKMLLKRKER